jgi:enoyl-CoA hydratase
MSMDGPRVGFERGPKGVALLTINHASNGNALSTEMSHALLARLDESLADDQVRVIVLKGAGRGFSSGADLSRYAPKGRDANADRLSLLERHVDSCMRLWESPKPIIGAVHGYCYGMASLYASCIDLVYIAEDATVGWPLPLGGGMLGPQWVYFVGARKAKEYSLIPATHISGREAADVGWANQAVPADDLERYVVDVASRMARVPMPLLRLKKDAINSVYDRLGFRETLRNAATWNAIGHTIPEIDEVTQMMHERGLKQTQQYYREPASDLLAPTSRGRDMR